MDRDQAGNFAEEWTEAWNRRDLDAVLAQFEDDVVFSSPRALQVVGAPTLRGKAVLEFGPTGRVVRGEVFHSVVPE